MLRELPKNMLYYISKLPEAMQALINKECELGDRWSEGTEHHPRSIALMNAIENIDFCLYNDYFCWKTGGDGDNGETLMYQMDAYFEMLDKVNNESTIETLQAVIRLQEERIVKLEQICKVQQQRISASN